MNSVSSLPKQKREKKAAFIANLTPEERIQHEG